MVGFFPVIIGAGVLGIAGLLVVALGGEGVMRYWKTFAESYAHRLNRADLSMKPEEFALIPPAIGVLAWVAIVFLYRPNALLAVLGLPICLVVAWYVTNMYLRISGDRRVNAFGGQLELILRMLAGALRVGLGLRQAVILVIEEVPDPARREFMRVIGRTNIGISILDALDELSKNMPSHEMTMFAKTVRVQSQTGGDLARVLETLATTIRDRRRVVRKMGALTAQGRFGAFIIGAMPFLVGGFVIGTQPDIAQALLQTGGGHIVLGIVGGLEGAAIFSLNKILQFDV